MTKRKEKNRIRKYKASLAKIAARREDRLDKWRKKKLLTPNVPQVGKWPNNAGYTPVTLRTGHCTECGVKGSCHKHDKPREYTYRDYIAHLFAKRGIK